MILILSGDEAYAYILMPNSGMRPGEALALKNCDRDLENKKLHIHKTLKKVNKRDGTKKTKGRIANLGKTKTKTSQRTAPLNNTAIEMIKELRNERYFGEDTTLICDEKGNHTNLVNGIKRYKATGWHNKSPNSKISRRPIRTQHLTDNGDVLCEKRYLKVARNYRWV